MKPYLLLLAVFFSVTAKAQQVVYNVKDFGAKADGITVDTKSINDAI